MNCTSETLNSTKGKEQIDRSLRSTVSRFSVNRRNGSRQHDQVEPTQTEELTNAQTNNHAMPVQIDHHNQQSSQEEELDGNAAIFAERL